MGEAGDGEAALKMITELSPDVVVLDVNMPGLTGFAVVESMRAKGLAAETVMLTMHNEEAMFAKALSLGVRGYVLKDSAVSDIVNCLHAVRRGQNFTSAEITKYLFKRRLGPDKTGRRTGVPHAGRTTSACDDCGIYDQSRDR